MNPKNSGSERVQSRPHYCGTTGPCPAEAVLGAILDKGGCIFCDEGVCLASPMIASMFAASAKSTRPAVPSYREATNPLPKVG
jgi:hypothetical protein